MKPEVSILAAMLLFGLFIAVLGKDPVEVYRLIWQGGFASSFSWQNTLSRAAPLTLTALCVALPAQAGLMIIGSEGALVLGGLAAAVVGSLMSGETPMVIKTTMALAGMLVGGLWVASAAATAQCWQESKGCLASKATALRISSSRATRIRSSVAPTWKGSVAARRSAWVRSASSVKVPAGPRYATRVGVLTGESVDGTRCSSRR